jgi:hypothetical protein
MVKFSLCSLSVIILLAARYRWVTISTTSSMSYGSRMHPLESCPEANFMQCSNEWNNTLVKPKLQCTAQDWLCVGKRMIPTFTRPTGWGLSDIEIMLNFSAGFSLLLFYKCCNYLIFNLPCKTFLISWRSTINKTAVMEDSFFFVLLHFTNILHNFLFTCQIFWNVEGYLIQQVHIVS